MPTSASNEKEHVAHKVFHVLQPRQELHGKSSPFRSWQVAPLQMCGVKNSSGQWRPNLMRERSRYFSKICQPLLPADAFL